MVWKPHRASAGLADPEAVVREISQLPRVYASQAQSAARRSLGSGKVRLGIRRQLDGQRGAIRGAKSGQQSHAASLRPT
jgi:hypothetical protein